MLILYTSPSCPFCDVVEDFAAENNIDLDVRDITEDDHMDALLEKGGRMQVPFFIDVERDHTMYESADIVAYLQEYYVN